MIGISLIITIWNGFVRLFWSWISIFLAPFKNPSVFWILIPLILTWIFTELFQEKRRTSFGNAISNGIVVIWVGIDWLRYLTNLLSTHEITMHALTIGKFFFSIIVLLYGISIVYFGIKAKEFVHVYGRIRETTYFLLMFTPFIYGILEPTTTVISAIFIFFPAFYFFIELLTKIIPDSKAVKDAMGKDTSDNSMLGKTHDDDLGDFMKDLESDNSSLNSDLPMSNNTFQSAPQQRSQIQRPMSPRTNYIQPQGRKPPINNSRQPQNQQFPQRRMDDIEDIDNIFRIL